MKVLVIGGVAASLVNFRGHLLRELVIRGHEVVALSGDNCPKSELTLKSWGVVHEQYALARASSNPVRDISTLASLYAAIRRQKPDCVLSYTIKPVIYASLAARMGGTKRCGAIISGLGYSFMGDGKKRRLIRRITISLLRLALRDRVVVFFQNHDDRRELLEANVVTPKQCHNVGGSGVDLNEYTYVRPHEGLPVFLLVARLLPEKGIREFVEAAVLLRSQGVRAIFRIAGGFDDNPSSIGKTELTSWVDSGTVEYLGTVADVRPHMAACHALVLPSYYREGVPRSILEAMATGRAIITTDWPGCRETVEEGKTGFLVPPRDVTLLAARMRQLATNREMLCAMGLEGRDRARRRFNVEDVTNTILQEMHLVSSNPSSRSTSR